MHLPDVGVSVFLLPMTTTMKHQNTSEYLFLDTVHSHRMSLYHLLLLQYGSIIDTVSNDDPIHMQLPSSAHGPYDTCSQLYSIA